MCLWYIYTHTHTQKFVLWSLTLRLPLKTDSTTENLTNESVNQDEKKREEDEACVPHPDGLVDGRDTEEHKDHGFRSIGKNLHGVSDCVDRILVHVCIDVFLATYTTEDDAAEQKKK